MNIKLTETLQSTDMEADHKVVPSLICSFASKNIHNQKSGVAGQHLEKYRKIVYVKRAMLPETLVKSCGLKPGCLPVISLLSTSSRIIILMWNN
jgi:hypothetical protein